MSIHVRHGIVVPDDFNVFPIARRAAIGDVDAVVRGVFTTESREAYANGHRADVACRARGQVTSSGVTLVFTRETSGRERRMKWVSCVDVTCTNTNDDIKYTIMGEHSCSHNVRARFTRVLICVASRRRAKCTLRNTARRPSLRTRENPQKWVFESQGRENIRDRMRA